MSTDSLAAFRKNMRKDLSDLAEQHMEHDLNQSDRDALRDAATTVGRSVQLGSLIGVGLGVFLAYRLRANRKRMFDAFKMHEQPTAVRLVDGSERPLPDLTPVLRPSRLGDFATYTFLGLGGIFVGGELGLLTGGVRARSRIGSDSERRERIETAFRRFQADALRKQADALDDRSKLTTMWN